MFDFFSQIIGYIESVFEYFLSFIDSLLTALNVLLSSMGFPTYLSGYMPSIIGSSVIIVVFVSVVKFILGR